MKIGDVFTLTRENCGSAGYTTGLVKLENFALIDFTRIPSAVGSIGAPSTLNFTFQAIKEGVGIIQFAVYQSWLLPAVSAEQELTFNIEGKAEIEKSDTLKGGWTPFREVDGEAKELFKNAFAHHVGAGFTPFLFTSHVVAGANYIFVANGKIVYPGATDFPALVSIFKDLDGKAHIKDIKALGHAESFGSYGPFRPVSEADEAILKQATHHFGGSGFKVDYVSTQLVSGLTYRFAGTQTITNKDGTKIPVLVTVYAPFSGKPYITSVQKAYDLI
jgi:hypothetical protein